MSGEGEPFLAAWKRGVEIAGRQFFGDGGDPADAKSKNDLAPDFDMVDRAMGYLSSGEGAFLAAMYSFYNAHAAAKMLAQRDVASPGALSATMDEPRVRVITALMASYVGW